MSRIAYVMSRFPKLTETFIMYEILAMEKHGAEIEIFPLLKERQTTRHPEAERLARRAHYQPFISLRILAAQWHFIARDPYTYFNVWLEVLRGTFGSFNFFLGALGIFPKTVYVAREMQRLNVAHVHAHFATHPAVAGLIIHRLTGIPFSFTVHGSDLHVERRMLKQKIEAAAFAAAISSYNKEVMVREGGIKDKIHVVHCGVDVDYWRPAVGIRNKHRLRIVCVASFEEVKGHSFLIEACAALAARNIDFDCHLIGEGPLKQEIQKQIAAGSLRSRFHLHGALPRAAVKEQLHKADVFVLASVPTKGGKREGIPVVLMEAMACGLPVVASDLSGIPELVDKNAGILVSPGNSLCIAEALAELHETPERGAVMGTFGREKIVREFNLEKNAAKLLDLLSMEHRRSAGMRDRPGLTTDSTVELISRRSGSSPAPFGPAHEP